MTVIDHASPMLLKLSEAVSSLAHSSGMGIAVGCTRSNGMAKGYTSRSLEKVRDHANDDLGCDNNITGDSRGVEAENHVDVTMILCAKTARLR